LWQPYLRSRTVRIHGATTRRTPAFREGKIERVERWLEELGLYLGGFRRTTFYSDSLNDLPLLSRVSNPVAVDPDPTLEAHARPMGWQIMHLHTAGDRR
jgi:phosphoserine phosphatase